MDKIDEFYCKHYPKMFDSGFVGRIAGFVHWVMETPYGKDSFYSKVLEVGSGNGQHFGYVKHGFDQYIESDIRANERLNGDEATEKWVRLIADAETLHNVEDNSIDRLIATCVLVHFGNPETALINWKRVVKKGGRLTIFVPTEPGMLLRFFRFFVTSRKAKKLGFDHKSVHYREHRNMWILCDILIRETFSDSKIAPRKFPLGLFPWNFRLFDVYEITK